MSDDLKLDMVRVQERIGTLQASVDKAHVRVDGLNAEVKAELDEISKDVKELLANMNQNKGSKGAWILVGSLSLGLLGALAKLFIK